MKRFTAIMVAWLAKFNPLMMILSALLIAFLTRGMGQVQTDFGIANDAVADIVVGIIYFVIIGCEFFISYKIKFKKEKQLKKENDFLTADKVLDSEESLQKEEK